jgi:tetratricopeptide (TPR) repeat protein
VYGQALFDAGRGDEAAAIFQQALSIDPENIIALRYLADIARDIGDRDAAMAWYRRVVDVDPKNEEVLLYIAQLSTGVAIDPLPLQAPPKLHTVHPEPVPDTDAVALGDLIHQPDVLQQVQIVDSDQPVKLPSINEFLISVQLDHPPVSTEAATSFTEESDNRQGDDVDIPFVTETMADLYRQQGFTLRALEIYRRLAREGDNPRVQEKVQELEQALAMEQPPAESAISLEEQSVSFQTDQTPTAATLTVHDFFTRIGARRPTLSGPLLATHGGLGELFGTAHLDASDTNAAASLANAYSR